MLKFCNERYFICTQPNFKNNRIICKYFFIITDTTDWTSNDI